MMKLFFLCLLEVIISCVVVITRNGFLLVDGETLHKTLGNIFFGEFYSRSCARGNRVTSGIF